MKSSELNSRISFLNLCNAGSGLDKAVADYFKSHNIYVIPSLKESNSYVAIVSDYPVDKVRLLQMLDPYRKFCDTVQLIIIKSKDVDKSQILTDLSWCGVTDVIYVDNYDEVLGELTESFERWYNINSFVNSDSLKKKFNSQKIEYNYMTIN